MKKLLLPIFSVLAGFTFSQSLTQANEPSIGTSSTLFLCDSFAARYENITGNNITWDYSVLAGYNNMTRTIDIEDATTTSNASDFPSSTKTVNMENSFSTFFNSTTYDRSSQGFVYNEPTFGTIVAKYNSNNEILLAYPFANGAYQTDTYSGTLDYTYSGFPQSKALTGTVHSWIDGQGTLLLNGSTINNVIRYKIVDTSLVPDNMIIGDLELIKENYEYYDLANSDMPVLILSKFTIQVPGSSNPLSEVSLVLSKVAPSEQVSLIKLNEKEFNIYPNPVKDILTIRGEFSINATAVILDHSGRILEEMQVNDNTTIDLSNYKVGMYLIKIENNGSSSIQKFLKR